jgi:hypothetical protein
MAQAATLAIDDREATPVEHSFVPRKIETELATFGESTGVPAGDNILSVSRRSTAAGTAKVRLRLTMPVVSTDTSTGVTITSVVRTAYGEVNLSFAPDSTTQERKNMVGLLANSLLEAQTVLDATLVDLENIF